MSPFPDRYSRFNLALLFLTYTCPLTYKTARLFQSCLHSNINYPGSFKKSTQLYPISVKPECLGFKFKWFQYSVESDTTSLSSIKHISNLDLLGHRSQHACHLLLYTENQTPSPISLFLFQWLPLPISRPKSQNLIRTQTSFLSHIPALTGIWPMGHSVNITSK